MYVRLAFAVAVHVDPDILIVDEVLAVGDEPFQRKCMDRIRDLQRQGKTIVLVTHALDQVAEFCDRAIVLEAGSVMFDGAPTQAIQTLRKDFETLKQKAEVSAKDGGRTHALIHSVTVRSLATGEPVDVIQSGEGLAIDVAISVPAPSDSWIVGMGIENNIGQNIFGTNSERLNVMPTMIAGETVFRFEVDPLPLGEGQYFLHASFGTLAEGEMVRLVQAANFSVTETSNNNGVVSSNARGFVASTASHV